MTSLRMECYLSGALMEYYHAQFSWKGNMGLIYHIVKKCHGLIVIVAFFHEVIPFVGILMPSSKAGL